MKSSLLWLLMLIACLALIPQIANGKSLTFESGNKQVTLVELYSSQGCSSCPPAQRWVNDFTMDERLWRDVIPVVFHVDYWDYLGWKDPFSSSDYSQRQQSFKQFGLSRNVYTPGFMVNGKEWRGWFKRKNLPLSQNNAGNIQAIWENDLLGVVYTPEKELGVGALMLNVALLGAENVTRVTAGENRRKRLKESFIVLEHQQFLRQVISNDEQIWKVAWAFNPEKTMKKYGVAAWITKDNGLETLQAAGTWIPDSWHE